VTPAVTADVLPDLDALPTRILQTIFGFGLLLRATVQSLAFLAAGGEDPEVDYRPRTKPAIATDEASMRVLLQAVSFGIGALLMAYVLAPGLLEAPLLRFAQAFWMLQAGMLMFTTAIDWLKP
jgi:hypothetical protein